MTAVLSRLRSGSKQMIHVIATITLNPGVRAAYLVEFARVTPLVRAEEGCLEYQATIDIRTMLPIQVPPREDVVTVVEKWASVEALYKHTQAPHMADFRTRTKDQVKSVQLQILQPA
jgi:quinol monooxygenase YgiN